MFVWCLVWSVESRYIFWYQNEKMVNYDTARAVSVRRYKDRTESLLTITAAGPRDQGNYTCNPSNAKEATVNIFVTRGEDGDNQLSTVVTGSQQVSVTGHLNNEITSDGWCSCSGLTMRDVFISLVCIFYILESIFLSDLVNYPSQREKTKRKSDENCRQWLEISRERAQGLKLFVKFPPRLCWDWLVSSPRI